MKRYKISHEDEKQYFIDDGKKVFAVAKHGLSKSLHEKIKHFAEGGEVDPPSLASPDLATERGVRHDGILEINQAGKKIRIAMSALSPAMKAKIQKLAYGGVIHAAEGVEVPYNPNAQLHEPSVERNIDPNVYADPHAAQQILEQQKSAEGMNAVGRAIAGVFKKTPRGMGPETGGEIDTQSLPEMGIQPAPPDPNVPKPAGPELPQTPAELQGYIDANRKPEPKTPGPNFSGLDKADKGRIDAANYLTQILERRTG